MNTAVPGTRVTFNVAMNSSSGGDFAVIASARMRRPVFHVTMTMKKHAATRMGTYPPSMNLRMFDAKNGMSNARNSARSGPLLDIGHPHVSRVTKKKTIDVMPIVPV